MTLFPMRHHVPPWMMEQAMAQRNRNLSLTSGKSL
jgi:hypothetical protein